MTMVVFSNEVCRTFSAMSSRTLLSDLEHSSEMCIHATGMHFRIVIVTCLLSLYSYIDAFVYIKTGMTFYTFWFVPLSAGISTYSHLINVPVRFGR